MYVLAADSDPVMCKAIKFLLGSDGHEVATVTTGADMVALAGEREPDLFVLDMALPDIDCLKIYQRLRLAGSRARVLFLVPRNDTVLQTSEGLELASGDFVIKPFEPDYLVSRVRRISTLVSRESRKEPAPRLTVGNLQLLPDLERILLREGNLVRILNLSRSEAEVAYLLLKDGGAASSLKGLARQLGLDPSNSHALDAVADCVHGLMLKVDDDPDRPRYFAVSPDQPCPVGLTRMPLAAVAESSAPRTG